MAGLAFRRNRVIEIPITQVSNQVTGAPKAIEIAAGDASERVRYRNLLAKIIIAVTGLEIVLILVVQSLPGKHVLKIEENQSGLVIVLSDVYPACCIGSGDRAPQGIVAVDRNQVIVFLGHRVLVILRLSIERVEGGLPHTPKQVILIFHLMPERVGLESRSSASIVCGIDAEVLIRLARSSHRGLANVDVIPRQVADDGHGSSGSVVPGAGDMTLWVLGGNHASGSVIDSVGTKVFSHLSASGQIWSFDTLPNQVLHHTDRAVK